MIPTQPPVRKHTGGPLDRWKGDFHVEQDRGAPSDEPLGEIVPCEHGMIWVDTTDPPRLGLTVSRKAFLEGREFKVMIGKGAIEVLGSDGGAYDAVILGLEREVFEMMGAYTHTEARDEFDVRG